MRYQRILLLLLLIFSGLFSQTYGQLRNLHVKKYDVISYNAFSGKLNLNLTIKNDSTDFIIRSFTGLVYQNKQPLVKITSASLYIPQGLSTIGAVCTVKRCKGVSFFRLVQCLFPFNLCDFTVDVSIAVQYPLSDIQMKEQKGISFSSYVDINE